MDGNSNMFEQTLHDWTQKKIRWDTKKDKMGHKIGEYDMYYNINDGTQIRDSEMCLNNEHS